MTKPLTSKLVKCIDIKKLHELISGKDTGCGISYDAFRNMCTEVESQYRHFMTINDDSRIKYEVLAEAMAAIREASFLAEAEYGGESAMDAFKTALEMAAKYISAHGFRGDMTISITTDNPDIGMRYVKKSEEE